MDDPTRFERAEMFCDAYLQSVYSKNTISLSEIDDDEMLHKIIAANCRAAFAAGTLNALRNPEELRQQIEGMGFVV